ncbi:MAG: SGNH/GDSL hydrolase family protein [Solirubrobacteraceae bacterium]
MRRKVAGFAVVMAVLALSATPAVAKPAANPRPYFISLGDSYSVGYQSNVGRTTLNGPASQLVKLAARRGYRFKLVSFGCGGATTTSMLTQLGCPTASRLPGAAGFPGKTQVQAAVAFIKRHPGKVGLVTISIGGNDVDGCLANADPLGCVGANMPKATANLTKIVKQLRAAGGKPMQIIGSTYPDVALGAWVLPTPFGDNRFTLAAESVTAFRRLINPGLQRAYRSVGAAFVDVTAATGAYGPFVTTNDPPYGVIPVPVATVCRLTFFCTRVDIHMTTAGYAVIARLEATALVPTAVIG